jgi:hypothetical protein
MLNTSPVKDLVLKALPKEPIDTKPFKELLKLSCLRLYPELISNENKEDYDNFFELLDGLCAFNP